MEEKFDYKITSNKVATVVTLQGKIAKDTLEQLERCRGDLVPLDTKIFILYFREVPGVEIAAFRHLTLIQQEIRKKNVQLWVVGLSPEIKTLLINKAIIRANEIKKCLEEALKTS